MAAMENYVSKPIFYRYFLNQYLNFLIIIFGNR